jgi:signal transduction histidine kinase
VARPLLDEITGYVGFDDADARLLAEMGPVLRPHFTPMIDRFYAVIQAHPGASRAITGGDAQVQRLKGTLVDWLEGLVGGVYDEAYYERRARIGRVHVRIDLDQRYMFAAMNLIREGLHEALGASEWPADRRQHGHAAIDRICDIELAIMLETYREAYIARMRSAERLATLGQFAASIGHDLRNPLAVIETSLHLLKRRVTDDPKAERHIGRIGDQVTLAGAIISDLLELARDRPSVRQPVDVRALIDEALGSVPPRPGARLDVQVPGDLPRASVDPGQMRQVVVNLVVNAVQAVTHDGSGGGTVRISADSKGDALRIAVQDDGHGIGEEAKARLFEPLFTTRAKGIGLGLALCKRIVEKHGGTITGRNRPEGGAEFIVLLPGAVGAAR